MQAGTEMNIQKAHALLGYCDEETMQAAAKAEQWNITQISLKQYKDCTREKASIPNGYVNMDLMMIEASENSRTTIWNANW